MADVESSLGTLSLDLETSDESEKMYRKALQLCRAALGHEHPTIATYLYNLGAALEWQGKLEEAESTLREAVAMQRKLLGKTHPRLPNSISRLAAVLWARGKLHEAEDLYLEVLAQRKDILGTDDPSPAVTCHKLAVLLRAEGKPTQADSVADETREIQSKLTDRERTDLASALGDEAHHLWLARRLEDAQSLAQCGIDSLNEIPPGADRDEAMMHCLDMFQRALASGGRSAEAERACLHAIQLLSQLPANQIHQRKLRWLLGSLGDILRDQGKLAEAAQAYRQGLALNLPSDWIRDWLERDLAEALKREGKLGELETLYRESIESRRNAHDPRALANALEALAGFLRESGRTAEAR